jgi:signal transduction histidine kinase
LGIFQLIDNRLSPLVIRGEAAPADFTCGLEDDEGNLWFGSEQGLWRARRPMLRTFSRAEGLVDNNCWSVSPGQDGTVWVNTTGGLGRIRDEKPLPAPGKNPNLWWDGRCVLAARDGNVWIGESGLGVFLLRGENYSIQLNWEVEKWSIQPWVLYEDPQNRIWGGFGHAVAVRIGETWRHWEQPAGWASDGVRAIHQARDGAMWFGTYGHGLVRHPRILAGAIPESLTNAAVFGLADGLKSLRVWAIYETDDGALWLGTENGLHRVPPGFGKQNEVGRSARSAKSIIHAFAAIDGLPEETVNAILEDDFGYFWLSGLRGIHRIKRAELEEVASGKRETVSCETFGADDGMASPETNGESQPAACKTPDGRLWFPTVAGVVVIDPRQLGPSEISPSVLLEEMAVDGATVLGDTVTNSISINGAARKSESHFKTGLGGIRLAPGQARVVQIRYTSPTFVGADKIRFRHRLRGLNDAWHEAGAERQAWFTNLKPGDYTFEVIASNSQGVWVTPPARIEFSLAPGFTQTAWFPALLAVAGASMAGGFIKWRLQWHRRASRAEQTAAIADERTRIARDLHDDLGTALTGLALELDLLGRDGDSEDADRLAEAARHARALGDQMREVVWVVNPLCDTLPQFAAFVEQQASQLVGAAGMRVRFDFPDPLLPREIGADTRHQFALATREALNNVARHSAASEVMVRLHADGCWLEVRIEDDGRGFQLPSEAPLNSLSGHGLSGLVERMTKVGGECRIVSSAGAGTQVILRAPLSSQASPSKKGEKT